MVYICLTELFRIEQFDRLSELFEIKLFDHLTVSKQMTDVWFNC